MKPRKRIFCIGCHHPKILFSTEDKANNFISFNQEEIARTSKKAPVRSYYCSFCCGWHVTSLEDSEKVKEIELRDSQKWETIKSSERLDSSYYIQKNKEQYKLQKQQIIVLVSKLHTILDRCITQFFALNLDDVHSQLTEFTPLYNNLLQLITDPFRYSRYLEKIEPKRIMIQSALSILNDIKDKKLEFNRLLEQKEDSNKIVNTFIFNSLYSDHFNHLFEALEKAKEREEKEEYDSIYNEIARLLKIKYKNTNQFTPKFSRRLKAHTFFKSHTIPLNLKRYIEAIDLIQKAYYLYEEGDEENSLYFLKRAKDIMPDACDERSEIIWNHINSLYAKLSH